MDYALAIKLKEAGFPQKGFGEGGFTVHKEKGTYCNCDMCEHEGQAGGYADENPEEQGHFYAPSLEELIEACGERFHQLRFMKEDKEWFAWSSYPEILEGKGSTPEEAVSNLIIALVKAGYVFVNGKLELNKK